MFEDLSKSIKALLYDRATSPFYSTFITSWIVWNWKILYLTFIVDPTLTGNKIDFIQSHYVDWFVNLWWPLLTTAFIIIVMPLFTIASKWIAAQYDRLKRWLIDPLERQQLLSLEESIALRQEVEQEKAKFNDLITKKDRELNEFRTLTGEYAKQISKFEEVNGTLIILKATFGTKEKYIDVTEKLNSMIKDGSIELHPDIKIFGDPAPGERKELNVIYSNRGKIEQKILAEGGGGYLILNLPMEENMAKMEEIRKKA